MMEQVFQQAPFDEKKDIRRIEEIAKDVEQRVKRMPSCRYDECSRCGKKGQGFSSFLDGSFLCVGCLIKDEVERKFKEAK